MLKTDLFHPIWDLPQSGDFSWFGFAWSKFPIPSIQPSKHKTSTSGQPRFKRAEFLWGLWRKADTFSSAPWRGSWNNRVTLEGWAPLTDSWWPRRSGLCGTHLYGCIFSWTPIPCPSEASLQLPSAPDAHDGVNDTNAPPEDVVRIHSYLSDSSGRAAAEVQIIVYRSHLIV